MGEDDKEDEDEHKDEDNKEDDDEDKDEDNEPRKALFGCNALV